MKTNVLELQSCHFSRMDISPIQFFLRGWSKEILYLIFMEAEANKLIGF